MTAPYHTTPKSVGDRMLRIEPTPPWDTFFCYPLPGYGIEQQYSYPGCRRYTLHELMSMCAQWGWTIREVTL